MYCNGYNEYKMYNYAVSYPILFFCGSFVAVQQLSGLPFIGSIIMCGQLGMAVSIVIILHQASCTVFETKIYHTLPYHANYSVAIDTLSTNLEYITHKL